MHSSSIFPRLGPNRWDSVRSRLSVTPNGRPGLPLKSRIASSIVPVRYLSAYMAGWDHMNVKRYAYAGSFSSPSRNAMLASTISKSSISHTGGSCIWSPSMVTGAPNANSGSACRTLQYPTSSMNMWSKDRQERPESGSSTGEKRPISVCGVMASSLAVLTLSEESRAVSSDIFAVVSRSLFSRTAGSASTVRTLLTRSRRRALERASTTSGSPSFSARSIRRATSGSSLKAMRRFDRCAAACDFSSSSSDLPLKDIPARSFRIDMSFLAFLR